MRFNDLTLSTTDDDPYWNRYYVTFPVNFSNNCFGSYVQLQPGINGLPDYIQHISVEYKYYTGKSDIIIPTGKTGSSKITLSCAYKLFYIGY